VIPEEWKRVELSNIFEISKNKFNPKNSNENKKCIELEHILQDTGRIIGYTYSNEQKSIKNVFEKNQVLFGKLRPYLKKFWKADFDGVCSTEIWVLNGKSVTNDYLFQLIQTNKFNQIANISSGSKMPRADWKYMSEIPFDIPPLKEQQKIAQILSTWDSAIGQQKALVTAKEELKKGLMQKLLSGEVRFEGFDGEWEEVRLGDISQVIMGQSPNSNSYNENKIGIPLIQGNADCKNRKTFPRIYTTEKTKECNIGDIIMTVRAPVGVISKSYHNACIGRGVCAIKSKQDNQFLYHFLVAYEKKWEKYSQGSTFTAVNGNDIKNLKISLPPLQEQQKIAQVLTTADKEITLLKEELEALKEQKRGLMQKLLTGEVRVKMNEGEKK
jgi:type I restriction enzyme S subunit